MLGVTQIDRVVEVVEHALQGNTVSLLNHRSSLPSLDLPKVRRNSCVEIIPISGGCLGNCPWAELQLQRISHCLLPGPRVHQCVLQMHGCETHGPKGRSSVAAGKRAEAPIAKRNMRVALCLPTPRRWRCSSQIPTLRLLESSLAQAIVARALQAASEGVSEVWLTSEDTGSVSSCAAGIYSGPCKAAHRKQMQVPMVLILVLTSHLC